MAEGSVVKEHWLHGKCYFNVDVEREHECRWCMHVFVCKRTMEDLCENFCFGTSEGRGHCDHCLHKYTRYERREKLPCFSCFMFEHRENLRPTASHFEVWQEHAEGEPAFRLGYCLVAVARQHKKLADYIHKHHEEISCASPDRPIHFIPITETEYEYHLALSEKNERGWLVEFTKEMIK